MDDIDQTTTTRPHRPGDPLADRRQIEEALSDRTPVDDFTPLRVVSTPSSLASPPTPAPWTRLRLARNLVLSICLALLILSFIGIEGVDLISRAQALHPWFGRVTGGIVILLLGLLTWTMAAAVVQYARVRRSLLAQPLDLVALQRDSRVEWERLQSARQQLAQHLAYFGAALPPATLAELQVVRAELGDWPADNTRLWLLRYDSEVLAIIDRAVADGIRSETINIAVLTLLSPLRSLDSLLVIWRQLRLIRLVALQYGWRPGFFGTLTLVRTVLTNATLAAGFEEVEDLAVEMLGGTVAARAGSMLGQAIGNAALTLRMARRTVDACRPIHNRAAAPYRVSLRQCVANLLQLSIAGRWREPSQPAPCSDM
jgi:putative membrane protein